MLRAQIKLSKRKCRRMQCEMNYIVNLQARYLLRLIHITLANDLN